MGLKFYPAPTYIVGIDEPQEKGYIVSANSENLESISSLSTKFPLNPENLKLLWDEVNNFWSQHKNINFVSHFSNQ